MEIRSEARIAHPRDRVYRAYRDRLPEIAAYIPDIKEVQVQSREERDGAVILHNVWVSDREIPAVAAKVLRPEHLRWDDHATWHDAEHAVTWTLKTRAFTDAVRCTGRNTFVADGADTVVRVSGELEIDLRDIPGVPGFLGKRLAPQVERFIVALIAPNLEAVNHALQRFLDASHAPAGAP